jgi:hypothetical protein
MNLVNAKVFLCALNFPGCHLTISFSQYYFQPGEYDTDDNDDSNNQHQDDDTQHAEDEHL